MYSEFPDLEALPTETNEWKRKWSKMLEKDRPNSAIETCVECHSEYFPNVKFLLKLLATLPVSTSTPERTHSTT